MSDTAEQRVRERAGRSTGTRARGRSSVSVSSSPESGQTQAPSPAQVQGDGQGRRRPRRARVYVTRLDPWSIAKVAFLLSLAIGIVIVVAVAVVFWTLDSTGALDAVSRTVDDVLGTGGFDLLTTLEFSRVLGLAAVIASVEIVLVSALATLFAYLYNISVGLTGGVEVILSDD
ncbi:MAG: DUF3566 domain-containing protein [Actinomycetota bacterium]|nr:DUF3566 domain-containing protein [Actinomycetota bacterium]